MLAGHRTLGSVLAITVLSVLLALAVLWPDSEGAQAQSSGPSVTGVAISSDAGNDDTYILGDVIKVTVTFSEAMSVSGTPQLKIDMDPAEWGEKWAGYESGSGTASLTFTHTVVEPNVSTQGIAVLADSLELNGGTIQSALSDTDADLSHAGLAHDAEHKVDWQQSPPAPTPTPEPTPPPAPTVTGVAISSDAGGDDTYALGDVIEVTLTFSEAVVVSGAPQLKIKMDPDYGEKQAAYHSGTGTTTLTFTHIVVEPNISTQGIAVLENTLEPNGGAIRSASSQEDAELAHSGLDHDAEHKVDWQQSPPAPTVTGLAISSDAGDNDTYTLGNVIEVTLTFSEAVDVTGNPQLTIKMDPDYGEKEAGYASGSGTASLTFAHTVVEPNVSTQGIAVLENTLELNGGSIRSASSQTDADLSHAGLSHNAEHKVDWQQTEPNHAPVVNTHAERYADFTATGNAPRGILVSKPFHAIFSDPDGDNLTYSVSVPDHQSRLVDELSITLDKDVRTAEHGDYEEGIFTRVWFQVEAETDWKAVSPALADPLTVTATLTATDPGGLSASVRGDFVVNWDSSPVLASATTDGNSIELTYDQAVEGTPAPTPGQFTVNVVNADGTAGTVSVSGVRVSGSVVTLELASELSEGQTVSVDYAHDDAAPLQRAGGGDPAPGFSEQAVDVSQLGLPGLVANLAVTAELGKLDLWARWDAVEGATSYRLRWRQSGGEFVADNIATSVSGGGAVVSVSDYGEWEVRVQACNDAGCGAEVSSTVDAVRAASLSLQRPLDAEGQVRPRTIAATWDPVPDAVSYTLRWQRLGTDPPTTQPEAGARQARALDGASGDSGQGANVQTSSELTVPAGRTNAEFTVPDDRAYRVELEAVDGDDKLIALAHSHMDQAGGGTDTTPPRLVRGEIDGNRVTFYFSEPLVEGPVGGYLEGGYIYSYVNVGGSVWGWDVTLGSDMEISGNKVTVDLGDLRAGVGRRAFAQYVRRAAATTNALRDLAGNPVSVPQHISHGWWGTGHITLDNITGRPYVTGVAISSDPGADRQYADGESIQVKITFTEAVNVTGTPRVKIDLSPGAGGEKWADYDASGSSATTLAFTYTVEEPDRSTRGIAVLQDMLDLNGGAIRSTATPPVNAHLWHAGLDHDPNHKVDWQRLPPGAPRVTGVAISSDPGADRLYVEDETIQVKLTFSEEMNVTGTPRVKIDFDPADGGEKWADYAGGSGATELTFEYTVEESDRSTAGVAVLRDTLEVNGGAILSTATPPVNAHLRHADLDHDPNHRVNSSMPMLQSATVDWTRLALTYDEALDESSTPVRTAFTVKVNGSAVSLGGDKPVSVSGPVVTLSLAAALASGETLTVSYAKPTGSGASKLRDKAGTEAPSFSDEPAGSDTTQPTLVRGEIDGDTITIYFSEPLDEHSWGAGDYFRISLFYKSFWAQDGQCPLGNISFTARPREMYVSGNTVVVVGLTNNVRRRASVGWTLALFYYVADAAVTPRLRDLSGNPVSTPRRIYDYDTESKTPTILLDNVTQLPYPKSATVVGNQLTLTFSAPMDGGWVPATSAFTVKANGSAVSLARANPVSVSGREVTLTLETALASTDTVTVSYAKPDSSPIRNVVCEYAPSFTDQAVTNATP